MLSDVDEAFDWNTAVAGLPVLPTPSALSTVLAPRLGQQSATICGLLASIDSLLQINLERSLELPLNQLLALLRRFMVLDHEILETSSLENRRNLLALHLLPCLEASWRTLTLLASAARSALSDQVLHLLASATSALEAFPHEADMREAIYAATTAVFHHVPDAGRAKPDLLSALIRHAVNDAQPLAAGPSQLLVKAAVMDPLISKYKKPRGGSARGASATLNSDAPANGRPGAAGAPSAPAPIGFDLYRPRENHLLAAQALQGWVGWRPVYQIFV